VTATHFENVFTPVPPPEEVKQFLLGLYQRRGEGILPRRANASIGTWKPQPHYCSENVDTWVRYKPEHKRVDGFVCFVYRKWRLNFVRFVPHCLVEVEDGTLVDITPPEAELSAQYPFIRHNGTREEFDALHAQQGTYIGLDLIGPE
jgi:hypothetical protein